jgi:cytochrome c-type biogenesis protein CcmH
MRLLAAFLLVLALAPVAAASENHPTLGELEGEVICPTCHTTLDQSSSPIAARMKLFIAARIRAGDTKSEIERKLVAQFGPEVIAKPSRHGFDLVAWLLPLVLLIGGAVAVAVAVWRWRSASAPAAEPAGSPNEEPLGPELERRVDEELARFDA